MRWLLVLVFLAAFCSAAYADNSLQKALELMNDVPVVWNVFRVVL